MNSVRERIDKLLVVLNAEEDLYLRMQKLLQGERAALVQLDVEAIEDCVCDKEMLAEEGLLLETSRMAAAAELCGAIGLPETNPTLRTVIQSLGAEGSDLEAAHLRLTALTSAVRELLDANDWFAGESLESVRSTLKLIGRSVPDSPIYGPTGDTGHPEVGGRIVRQSV